MPFRFISTVGRGYEMDDVLELTHIENISTFPSREKTDIARIDTCASEIARAIRSSKQSFSAYDFANRVINYAMLDLHILDKTNKPITNKDIFEPIEYVSKFLKYITSDDFNADFHIWNNFYDKQSYQFNIVEESLKAIVTKNASLFNLFIWAWGTFIIVFEDDNTEQNQGLKHFKDSLHKMVEMYEKAKENQKNKAYSEWGKFIRYQSVWAAKSQEEYLNTVYAYEEMLRALFRNQFTQKSTIKKIEFTPVSLKFYLEIDGNKLIQRLNTVHQNLIDMFDDREFSKGHLTSMKILRYWLLSQVSNTTRNKNRNEPGNIQWGSGSGFSIQNRKNNDHSTGITLIFSL
ncbi:MAG: hypothetical protein HUU34_14405 [Saprospiraceae bacterium]|nr:hypothetical protein [Saprospiraceae bacterium]